MGRILQRHKKMHRGDGYIYYLDCDDGFVGVCTFQTLSNYGLKNASYCINPTSMNLKTIVDC